jgi:hypothetical protein
MSNRKTSRTSTGVRHARFWAACSHALNTFVASRMQRAVPEWRYREAQRDVGRFGRLAHRHS